MHTKNSVTRHNRHGTGVYASVQATSREQESQQPCNMNVMCPTRVISHTVPPRIQGLMRRRRLTSGESADLRDGLLGAPVGAGLGTGKSERFRSYRQGYYFSAQNLDVAGSVSTQRTHTTRKL